MTSPARRHFQRLMAANAASEATPHQPQNGPAYDLMRAALVEDMRRLHDIQSIERKIELKRELLPVYAPYVEGVLSAGNGAEDDVLMTVMVWRFDAGDLEGGLDIAEYALKHNLQTPDRYQRKPATLIAEECADMALRSIADHPDPASLLVQLDRALKLTKDSDMHDQVRAKLHKAAGYTNRAIGDAPRALEHLQRALELDNRSGVKKDIERLEREIKNSVDAAKADGKTES